MSLAQILQQATQAIPLTAEAHNVRDTDIVGAPDGMVAMADRALAFIDFVQTGVDRATEALSNTNAPDVRIRNVETGVTQA